LQASSNSLGPFVGTVVRTLREANGWSQEELALRAKIYPNQISLLESAKRHSTLPTLEKVARALDVECYELLWQALMLQRRVERDRTGS
jgi:transcriptional regulator with XRE-family HTH domain